MGISFRTFFLTSVVMTAFAANSVLGRAALKAADDVLIDPATYSAVRILSGAIMLIFVVTARRSGRQGVGNEQTTKAETADRPPADGTAGIHDPAVERLVGRRSMIRQTVFQTLCLVGYATTFSYAYVRLDAAAGTLILFAAVQLTMVTCAAIQGESPSFRELIGLSIAFAGLLWMVAPSLSEVRLPTAAALMFLSGIAWGLYSIAGKGSKTAIDDTCRNFTAGSLLVVPLMLMGTEPFTMTSRGFWLAATSGAITSGLGYTLWYLVLPRLRSTAAAAAQLSVPIIAAAGGVLFASDSVSARTVVAGGVILAGIALVTIQKT